MRANMEEETKKKGGYIGQAWLVILLALVYGGALAGVQTALDPVIQENRRKETYDVIPKLVPGADAAKTKKFTITDAQGKERHVYQANGAAGAQLGWVVPAGGQGFADRIDLLIGINDDLSKITGMYVLDQKETPGLGNYIGQDFFEKRFKNKRTDQPLVVVKGDPAPDSNEIKALTGATISSDSVATIVNNAIADVEKPLRQLKADPGTAPQKTPEQKTPKQDTP